MSNERVRAEFPLLAQPSRGKPFIYLDSSNTSQKPRCVIDATQHFYAAQNANIHRGVYELSERATKMFEQTREFIKEFINAAHSHEIIFVNGTTAGINLVAQSYGRCKVYSRR